MASQVALVVKNPLANTRDTDSIPGPGIFQNRKWQPTPVFLPGRLHGQRSYSPWGCKALGASEHTNFLGQTRISKKGVGRR